MAGGILKSGGIDHSLLYDYVISQIFKVSNSVMSRGRVRYR